jgi:hypothetical protein
VKNLFRRALIATTIVLSNVVNAAAPAVAAAPGAVPTYAFLSLIGDKLEIVIAQQQIGSLLDRNRREPPILIQDPVFDNTAAFSAGEAIRKIIPNAELAVLNSRSAVLFEKQRELFDIKDGVMAVPDAIRTALQNEKATHLILIAKHRDEAFFRFTNSNAGAGTLEGLGFYLDGAIETRSGDTGETGRGYIAPYAYAKVTLVDSRTLKVLKSQTIKATMPVSAARAGDNLGSPWAALTSAEKVGAINRLIQREMKRVIPLMIQAE